MAIKDFWISIRSADRQRSSQVVEHSLRPDVGRNTRTIAPSDIWICEASVAGYDPIDFDFLSEEDRERLTRSVERFREVAREVPEHEPATDEQVRVAGDAFTTILEIVRPDRYGDLDAFVIGTKIEQEFAARRPSWVSELIFETGYDSSSEPAIWIWVVADDAGRSKTAIFQGFDEVRQTLWDVARHVCSDRWPFIRLRTVSEQMAPGKAEAKRKRGKTIDK